MSECFTSYYFSNSKKNERREGSFVYQSEIAASAGCDVPNQAFQLTCPFHVESETVTEAKQWKCMKHEGATRPIQTTKNGGEKEKKKQKQFY